MAFTDNNLVEEAASWLKMGLRMRRDIAGPDYAITFHACAWLSDVYEAQGLYAEALTLYQEYPAKLSLEKGPSHQYMAYVQRRIDNVNDLLAKEKERDEDSEEVAWDSEVETESDGEISSDGEMNA